MISYRNFGNVREDYEHKEREVSPVGLIKDPSLILKFYNMHIKGKPFKHDSFLYGACTEFLVKEITDDKIDPCLGLGFAILSEDMLNVARWDTKYPTVVKNQIYGYICSDFRTAELLDIRDVGSFCIWELGIVTHEKEAWKRFLESKRSEEDKKQYLDSMIEGSL